MIDIFIQGVLLGGGAVIVYLVVDIWRLKREYR